MPEQMQPGHDDQSGGHAHDPRGHAAHGGPDPLSGEIPALHLDPPKQLNPNQRKLMQTLLFGLGAGLVGVLVVGLLVVTVGIYKGGWSNPLTRVVEEALPLPVASVNGEVIRFSEFNDDLETVHKFFAKQQVDAGDQKIEVPTEEQLRSGVLERLIQKQVLTQQANEHKITVTQAEIDDEFKKIADSTSGQAEQEIQDMYGWTIAQFKEKVLRTYMVQNKLGEKLATDEALTKPLSDKAADVAKRAKAGEDFGALAKEFSEDPGSGPQGGDLGFFKPGDMVPEFDAAAFAMKKGDVSDVVKTQFGWHVIKVTDLKKDRKGVTTEVQASHVLIAGPSVEKFLADKKKAAKIARYIKTEALPEETPEGALQ